MANIKVTESELKAKKDQLNELNERFKAEVTTLETSQQALDKMWDGDANTAFNNAFIQDKAKMDKFYETMKKYVEALGTIADKYAKAESQTLNIAQTRTYK